MIPFSKWQPACNGIQPFCVGNTSTNGWLGLGQVVGSWVGTEHDAKLAYFWTIVLNLL